MKYLILLLFPLTLFSMTVEEIDLRVIEIDARQLEIPDEIAPIQVVIDEKETDIAPYNTAIEAIDVNITSKQGEIDAKQALIDSKAVERDALPEEDPGIIVLQDEINDLVIERDDLQVEKVQLLSDKQAQEDLKTPDQLILDEKLAEKLALTNEQNYLVIERGRILDDKRRILWQARFDALPDLRMAMEETGLQQPNAKVFVRNILDSAVETKLLQLEAVVAQVTLDLQKAAIEKGIDERFRCADKVKKKMFYLNYSKGLTKAQVKQFVKDFKDIIDLIDTGSLDSASEEIAALTADGVLITETDKIDMIATIDSCK